MKELVEPADDEREGERKRGESGEEYEWEQRRIYIVPCAWRIQV